MTAAARTNACQPEPSQCTNATVTSTVADVSQLTRSRSSTLRYRGTSASTTPSRPDPRRESRATSSALTRETRARAASALAHRPATSVSTIAATTSQSMGDITQALPAPPDPARVPLPRARNRAAGPASRTWRHARRGRRGHIRANAGFRACREVRARPASGDAPGSPARRRPAGRAPRHRAGRALGLAHPRPPCPRAPRPDAAASAHPWETRAHPWALAHPSSAHAGQTWPAHPRAAQRAPRADVCASGRAHGGLWPRGRSRRRGSPTRWRCRCSPNVHRSVAVLSPAAGGIALDAGLPAPRARRSSGRQAARPRRRVAGTCLVPLIGVDDVPDQPVPDDVMAGQPGEINIRDAFEYLLDDAQPAHPLWRQVDLGNITGHHYPGAEPKPGEEHPHLLARRVLRLV